MTTIINGSSPSITFSDSTTQTTAGLTGSTSQLAKAWVNFSGSGSTTVNSSFNVSSVTYNSTGVYTVNFSTAMSNANYAPLVTIATITSAPVLARAYNLLVGSFQIQTLSSGFGLQDSPLTAVSVFSA